MYSHTSEVSPTANQGGTPLPESSICRKVSGRTDMAIANRRGRPVSAKSFLPLLKYPRAALLLPPFPFSLLVLKQSIQYELRPPSPVARPRPFALRKRL